MLRNTIVCDECMKDITSLDRINIPKIELRIFKVSGQEILEEIILDRTSGVMGEYLDFCSFECFVNYFREKLLYFKNFEKTQGIEKGEKS